MTSLVDKTATAAKWSTVDVFIRQGVQFGVSMVLARLLAPDDFGIVALLTLFTGVAVVLIDGGLSSALIQRQGTSHVDESTVFFFNVGMGGLSGVVLYAASPWIASFFDLPVLVDLSSVIAFSLAVGALGSIHTALLTKEMNFKILAKVGGISSVVAGSLALYMAAQGYGVWSLVGHTVASSIITVVLLWAWHPWRPTWNFSAASLQSLFRFGGYEMASTLLDVFYTNLYSILIGKLYSVRDVGLFSRARNTQLVPVTMMAGVIQRVMYSSFASVAEDKIRLVRGLRRAQAVVMLINMPITVSIIILAEPLVHALFGEQWLACVPILQVLGLSGILWPLSILNLNLLRAQGHAHLRLKIEVLKKGIAILMTLGASYHGVMAIAWAQVAVSVTTYYLNSYHMKILLSYGSLDQLRDLAINFATVIPMVIVLYFVVGAVQTLPIIKLAVASAVGSGIYLVTCRMFCAELLNESLALIGMRARHAKS